MSAIPRMRTVKQCVEYLKAQDPECCVGEWAVRKMVAQNKFPTIRTGNKILINLDALLGYLSGANAVTEMGGDTND